LEENNILQPSYKNKLIES